MPRRRTTMPARAAASPRRRFAAASEALRRFESLLAEHACAQWAVADALVELVDCHGYRLASLARRFGRRRNTLSAYYHTAKTFGAEQRDAAVAFAAYDNARQAASRFGLRPDACLRDIVAEGLTQRRQVSRYFAARARARENAQAARRAMRSGSAAMRLINRCHHADCRLIAQMLPEGSVKLANLDLPYGPYAGYADGTHDRSGLTRRDCDGNEQDAVTALLDDLLRLLAPKIAPGGAVLLYRPGGAVDAMAPCLTASAEAHGWSIPHMLVWDKRRTKLGRSTAPYTTRTERIYVLHRQGDELVNHDGSSRDDILSVAAARYRRGEEGQHHLFEKPLELCRRLIAKHTYEGELVFDACGCSGAMCIAAAQLNRRWVYCETNRANYTWGAARIRQAVPTAQSAV